MSDNASGSTRGRRRERSGDEYVPYSNEASEDDSDPDESTEEEENGQNQISNEEEEDVDKIQQIVGIKNVESIDDTDDSVDFDEIPPEKIRYYVKWANKSFIHNTWMTEIEILDVPGGENALKKFKNRTSDGLTKSRSNPDILTVYQEDMDDSWTQVDRLLGEADDGDYYVKWKNLPYEDATWENPEDIPDFENALKAYKKRRSHENMKRISDAIQRPSGTFTPLKTMGKAEDGSELRDYQIDGVNWLLYCYYEHRNSILADEMGLGKTVQIVMTLKKISEITKINGPFLVISPLSTLQQWRREFEKWSDLNTVVFHGKPASREVILNFEFTTDDEAENKVGFDVLITNYETFTSEFEYFKPIEWRYLVLDEGHRLKNHTGKCYQLLTQLTFEHCTLLTGTPIQNNVEELWSLLHLLHPQEFEDLPEFLERFGHIDDINTLQALQELIQPYILRRRKNDVEATLTKLEETIIEVELTRIQKQYYTTLLHENASVLMQQITGGSLPSLQNLMMQLRKVCNHPYLIKGASEFIEKMIRDKLGNEATDDDVQLQSLIESSGKMILLDKLLPKLHQEGHKVLIFSQMVKVLDIIEDYLIKKDIDCERIDGNVPEPERNAAIDRFVNNENCYIFLLCTRAGGVGINLTAADTVIIYDSDWNPQNDIQAQSRCHRIGQTQKVKVYRLVTRGTYELEMLDRASKKLGLDHALLDGGEIGKSDPVQATEIEKLLRHGAYNITHDDDSETDKFVAADIDQILGSRTTERTHDLTSNSFFSKKQFFSENKSQEDEINSADFWQNILPSAEQEILEERRCRKNKISFDESSDYDYSDENNNQTDNSKQKKRYSPVSLRATIRRLIHLGLSENQYERAILYFAAMDHTYLEENDAKEICELLKIDSLDKPTEDIVNSLNEFSSNLNDAHERSQSIVRRCLTFKHLESIIRKIQLPLDMWPINENADPMDDYAFLLGVFRNGIGETDSITEGLGVNELHIASIKALEKKLLNLMNALELQLKDVEIPKLSKPSDSIQRDPKWRNSFRGDEMLPLEWKENHMMLYNRTELSKEESTALFQAIHAFGVPLNENKEKDWKKLREIAKLNGVAIEAVEKMGEIILNLGMKSRVEEDFNQALEPYKQCFGNFSTRLWFKKMFQPVCDLAKIRDFVASLSEREIRLIEKVKQFPAAEWWRTEHDIALLKALAKYGLVFVTLFIMQEDSPFRKLIPPNLTNEFEKCCEMEKTRYKPCKPTDAGVLSFLYKDKLRITRAISVVRSVDTMREKGKLLALEMRKPKVNQIPQLPLVLIFNELIITSFGTFSSPYQQNPNGFKSRRFFADVKNPDQSVWYDLTINDGLFVIKNPSNNMVFRGHSAQEAYENLLNLLPKKEEFNTMNGLILFGLKFPIVEEALDTIKKSLFGQKLPMPAIQKLPMPMFNLNQQTPKPFVLPQAPTQNFTSPQQFTSLSNIPSPIISQTQKPPLGPPQRFTSLPNITNSIISPPQNIPKQNFTSPQKITPLSIIPPPQNIIPPLNPKFPPVQPSITRFVSQQIIPQILTPQNNTQPIVNQPIIPAITLTSPQINSSVPNVTIKQTVSSPVVKKVQVKQETSSISNVIDNTNKVSAPKVVKIKHVNAGK